MRHIGLQNTGYFLSELVAENNSSLPLAAALPLKSELFCAAGPRNGNGAEDHPTCSLPLSEEL